MKQVDIYTDGGCTPNPGDGGWGAVLIHGEHVRKLSGGEADTTNNQMELIAAIRGLEALKEPCQVNLYSDSQYLIMTMAGYWKRKKNLDLWDQLDKAASRHKIEWHWIRGHSGNEWNEEAHKLAEAAMRQIALP